MNRAAFPAQPIAFGNVTRNNPKVRSFPILNEGISLAKKLHRAGSSLRTIGETLSENGWVKLPRLIPVDLARELLRRDVAIVDVRIGQPHGRRDGLEQAHAAAHPRHVIGDAVVSDDAVLVTCAYLVDSSKPWVMQSLFLTAIGDARDKGARALEAFSYRYSESDSTFERART